MTRGALAIVAAAATWMSIVGGAPASAQAPAAAPARPRLVAPIKGVAEIGFLKPVVKVVGNEVVTTMKIKNLSTGAIAGLKIDEFWYDTAGNMLPGDSERVRQPLQPGQVIDVELRTPKNANMKSNNYQFSHANGTIKPKVLDKL
ncbi:MAG: hypothetical protein AB7I50_02760 [Vicinamibacterales bacterium]